MQQGGDWRITGEDRAKHDAQFNQLKPVNGFITGEAARGFLFQSGLPQQVLGHIWSLSDFNSDGKLDKLEFSIAMYLIKKKLTGTELPRTLPPSLKQAPAPVMGSFGPQAMGMVGGFGAMPGMQMGMQGGVGVQPGGFNTMPSRTGSLAGFGSVPPQQSAMARAATMQASPERTRASSVGADWGVPHNTKLKYTQLFNTMDRTRSGFLTGAQARTVLVQSGLAQAHLAQIWGLADVDNDGKLTCEEFCLAMHLVEIVKMGQPLPQALPPDLVPPSFRRGRSSSLSGGVPPTPAPAPAMPTPGMMASMGAGGFPGATPLGGPPGMAAATPVSMGAPLGGGGMPGMPPGGFGGGLGAMGAPLSPALVKQQSVDDQQPAAEERLTPVSFEDRKRQNFEKGQMELERRRAALREIQEKEKERQREIERHEQEKKERIRMEQERRRQLELERQMQKQREIEAEREGQRRKMEEQREAARRELERQRQLELERQRRQELEAKRIKSQEEVCHLKATNKTLACEIATLEDKKNELNKKLSETVGYVKEHQTTIILMGQNRDARVAEMDQLQQKIQELRHMKQQRAQQKEELQEQAKKLNINTQMSDTYAVVMTSYTNKKKTLEKLREALDEVERKTAAKLQDTDTGNSRLNEMKANLVREQNETDQLQKQYQVKMTEYSKTKKRMEDGKRQAQNQTNEKIKLEALRKKREEDEKQKKFEAIRLAQQQAGKKKGEEEKAKTAKKDDPFAAFGSSDSDPFASAFGGSASVSSTPADPSDPFAAFAGSATVQSSTSTSEKKDPFGSFGADFSNSNFDFGQGFKTQSSSSSTTATSSSSITPLAATTPTTPATAATSPAASLATAFAPTPQPRAPTLPTSAATSVGATIQPPPVAATSQASPLASKPLPLGSSKEVGTTSDAATNHSMTALPSDLKAVLLQYKGLYQFDAEGPDELSIKPGDIILVGKDQKGEPGWLGGECNGRTGWFPENYAEKILPSPPPTPKKPEAKSEAVVNSSIDSLSWASFGSSQKTEEVKQQSAPVQSTSAPIPTPAQTQAQVPIPAPVKASTTLAPSPATIPSTQEPVRRAPAPPIKAKTEPTPAPPSAKTEQSPSPAPRESKTKSVSALAAAFTAAAEASTVPQVSKPKPLQEEPKVEEKVAETEQIYDVIEDKPKAAERQGKAPTAPDAKSGFTKVVPASGSTPSPTPNQGTRASPDSRVKALYDWDAKKENHLSFKAGVMITILEKQDMWWMGEIDGRQGWFPKAHVQFLEDLPEPGAHSSQNDSEAFALYANTPKVQPDQSSFALYANTPRVTKQSSPTPPPQPQQQQQSLQQTAAVAATEVASSQPVESSAPPPASSAGSMNEECTALYSYSSAEAGDLVFEAGEIVTVVSKDGDWWTGRVGGREGIFPSNYVQVSMATTQGASTAPGGPLLAPAGLSIVPADIAAKTGSLSKKPEIARVIAAYEATGNEQLGLTVGQLIMVRKKNPSGWWEGELQARGKKRKIGWFPANYVKLMDSGAAGAKAPGTPNEEPKSPMVLAPPPQANQRLTPGIDIVCQVITIYPYVKQNNDELNFQKGMVINVMDRDDPDWWRGELNGATGVFPSNYVQELGESKPEGTTDWTQDVHLLESMSDREQHRQSRIHELIQTEQAYVDDMQLVVEVFQKPILESGMMTPQEMASVFVNWKELIQCNTKLLKALRVRKKMSGDDQPIHKIGDILCEQLPRMTSYIRFCSCQLSASSTLSKKIEGEPEFKEYVKKLGTDTRTKGMPVSSYLIKPMQRITKYPLLIQKILKYTPETHADYIQIKTATEKAEELCQQVNEGVREKENSDRLEWLQSHLDCAGLAEELIFNSITNCLGPRKYLHSGKLNKAKSSKELYVFLFNDFLLFTQPVKSGLPAPFSNTDVKNMMCYKMYKHPLFLNEVEVKIPTDVAADDFVFHINHIDKVYALKGESNNDRNRWKDKIEKASKNYMETEKKKREKLQRVRSQRSKGVGRLMVVIIEGYELKPSNSVTGRSDPYCEVSMGPQEHKTKVVPDNLNPIWDSNMQFIIRDLQEDVLCITVYDRDFFSPNDFLGRTEVRVADIFKETQGRGPVTKRLLLHEVSTGEIKVKLTLHLFDQS